MNLANSSLLYEDKYIYFNELLLIYLLRKEKCVCLKQSLLLFTRTSTFLLLLAILLTFSTLLSFISISL